MLKLPLVGRFLQGKKTARLVSAAALLEETDLRVVEAASAEETLDYLRRHGDEVAFLFAGPSPGETWRC